MGCSWKIRWTVVLVILDVVLLIGCPILLIVFGVSLVKPYHATRNFAETSCSVIGQKTAGTISCHCDNGPNCKSYYPCVEILVNYTAHDGAVQSGTLFDDAHNFLNYGYFSVTNNPKAIKCSTYSCEGDINHDASNVLTFINEYGSIGQSYTCYYNEEDPSEALVHKVSVSYVALGIALPLFFFVLAVILGLFLYHSVLTRKGEKVLCLGRKYEMEPNELSPPGALGQPVGESTF